MKLFLFENVDKVSDNYHCGGSCVIVAENEEMAKSLSKTEKYLELTDDDWKDCISFTLNHTFPPTVYIFPNAGCC